jgi:hypothetical protein
MEDRVPENNEWITEWIFLTRENNSLGLTGGINSL